LKNKKQVPGQVLVSRSEVSEAIKFALSKGWRLAPSPVNAAFVIDRAIEKMMK